MVWYSYINLTFIIPFLFYYCYLRKKNASLKEESLNLVIISVFFPNCIRSLEELPCALSSSSLTSYYFCTSKFLLFFYFQIPRPYCLMESVLWFCLKSGSHSVVSNSL